MASGKKMYHGISVTYNPVYEELTDRVREDVEGCMESAAREWSRSLAAPGFSQLPEELQHDVENCMADVAREMELLDGSRDDGVMLDQVCSEYYCEKMSL